MTTSTPEEKSGEKTDEKLDPRVWRIIAVVLLGPLMTQLDSTVVNVSLVSIQHTLGATLATAQWTISGYLLALALMLPLNGYLVGKFGIRRLYLFCFAAFTLTSALCGAAQTMDQLIGARILQGVAGGLLTPMTGLMVAQLAGRFMARVVGIMSVPVLFAPLMGPVIAGVILKELSWRWLFLINLPIGVIALVAVAVMLPRDSKQPSAKPFDLLGFTLISPALALMLYGIEGGSHLPLFFVGAIFLALFIAHAVKAREKSLIDLELFRHPVFSAAVQTQFFSNGVIYAGQFLVPLYLLTGAGLTPTETGWILMPMGLGMIVVFPTIGFLVERFGNRNVALAGVLINVVGTLPFLYLIAHGFEKWIAITALIMRGIGQGATGIPSTSAAYASVPREKLANGTTAINIVQRLGGPVFTTVLALVVSMSAHTFQIPFIALIVLQAAALVSVVRLPGRAKA